MFDRIYRRQCWAPGQRLAHYYFNQLSKECAVVQYGGCESLSRNIFPDMITCTNFCSKSTGRRKSPRSHRHRHTGGTQQRPECFDVFDPGYGAKDPYCSLSARSYHYYNSELNSCNATQYYHGCGGNGNRFPSIDECQFKCEYEADKKKSQMLKRSNGAHKSLSACFAPLSNGFCPYPDGKLRFELMLAKSFNFKISYTYCFSIGFDTIMTTTSWDVMLFTMLDVVATTIVLVLYQPVMISVVVCSSLNLVRNFEIAEA